MSNKKNLDDNLLIYNRHKIRIGIDVNGRPWFHAGDIVKAIGYSDFRATIKRVLDKDYLQEKSSIKTVSIPKGPFNTLYIDEKGVSELVNKTRLKKAQDFLEWYEDVMPEIKDYCRLKSIEKYEEDIAQVLDKIEYLEKQNELLYAKNHIKQDTILYVIDYTDEDDNLYYITSSRDINNKIKTGNVDKSHGRLIVFTEQTHYPERMKICLRAMLFDFRTKRGRNFYQCSLGVIKKAFRNSRQGIVTSGQQRGGTPNIIEIEVEKLDDQLSRLNKKVAKLNKKYVS